jgi:predicted RNA-binding Zn-ribbon protein involved in translation (DUF1610 family)
MTPPLDSYGVPRPNPAKADEPCPACGGPLDVYRAGLDGRAYLCPRCGWAWAAS